MSLGTNRDYKTRDRAAHINLQLHKIMMDKLIADGMTKESASKQAFTEMMAIPYKKRRSIIDGEVAR